MPFNYFTTFQLEGSMKSAAGNSAIVCISAFHQKELLSRRCGERRSHWWALWRKERLIGKFGLLVQTSCLLWLIEQFSSSNRPLEDLSQNNFCSCRSGPSHRRKAENRHHSLNLISFWNLQVFFLFLTELGLRYDSSIYHQQRLFTNLASQISNPESGFQTVPAPAASAHSWTVRIAIDNVD